MVICDRCGGGETWRRIKNITITIRQPGEEISKNIVVKDFCNDCVDLIRKGILDLAKPPVKPPQGYKFSAGSIKEAWLAQCISGDPDIFIKGLIDNEF